jgi:ABC-type transport system involved in multi-copper enzyme maturation permease subunit
MKNLRGLVFENPMLIDMKRAYRRFFGVSRMKAANAAVLVLSAILYGILLLITLAYRTAFSAEAMVHVQTFLICFVIPSVMHGAIAAEREKRTWDLLLVAPVTNAQIVIGKFIGGTITVLVIFGLMLIPLLLSFEYKGQVSFWSVVRAQAISLSFGIFLTALSLGISARSKRTFGAQIGIYGLIVLTLIVWPMMAASMGLHGKEETTMIFNPFYAIDIAWDRGEFFDFARQRYYRSIYFTGWFHSILYLGLTAAILIVTTLKLKAPDQEGLGRKANA